MDFEEEKLIWTECRKGKKMRRKENKLVVTFHTTAEAMAMERACREVGAPGRMIPVPRALSAGCGLAWCADPADREIILAVLRQNRLEEALHEIMV